MRERTDKTTTLAAGNGEGLPRPKAPAIHAGARVLQELAVAGTAGLSQSELGRAVGLAKSSIHGLLTALVDVGFVSRDGATRRYRLGPALIPLGTAASSAISGFDLAAERIAPLPAQHGLTFGIARRSADEQGEHTYVIHHAYPNDVHVGIMIGKRFGPFDSALGKCLLGSMPPEEAARMITAGSPVAHTERTILSRDELESAAADVRSRGWATSIQEFNSNNSVAAPIFDREAHATLFLIAIGFPDQLPPTDADALGRELSALARDLTTESGGAAPSHWRAWTDDS